MSQNELDPFSTSMHTSPSLFSLLPSLIWQAQLLESDFFFVSDLHHPFFALLSLVLMDSHLAQALNSPAVSLSHIPSSQASLPDNE